LVSLLISVLISRQVQRLLREKDSAAYDPMRFCNTTKAWIFHAITAKIADTVSVCAVNEIALHICSVMMRLVMMSLACAVCGGGQECCCPAQPGRQ
jgi:hypothetical protein